MTEKIPARFTPSAFNLSAWALKHQTLVLFAMMALALAGLQAYLSLGRAEDPDFTFKVMVVSTKWPGATAREMELQVTDKLEKVLRQVPWYDYVSSYSRPGESVLLVVLRHDTPKPAVAESWYQVRKRVNDQRGTLPQGVQGPYFNDEFGDTFGTIYAFTSDGFGPTELRHAVDDVRQRLLRVADVAKAEIIGEQAERIYVEFSNHRLATFGLATSDFIAALQKQTAVAATGIVETSADRVALRIGDTVETVQAIADIPVVVGGRSLRVGDVARVTRGTEDPRSFTMRANGRPALGLAVSMIEGGNVQTMGEGLAREMARIKKELPAGIEVEQIADQHRVVEDAFREFLQSLAEALAIVLVVSFLSLGLRTGLVVALSVPLVLATTFVAMEIIGIDLHRISLGALIISLGLLVDDAIIAVEMMAVKLEEGFSRLEAASFAYQSTAFPMLTGTLVTAAGFIPVGFAKSTAGEYTGAIFWVVGAALLISWFTAVVFTPYLGFKLLPVAKHAGTARKDPYQTRPYLIFRRLLVWSIDRRWVVIGTMAEAFVVALGLFRLVPQQFFPSSTRPELVVDLRLAGGSSFVATEAVVARLEAHLAKDPDVERYTFYTGAGTPRFYLPMTVELKNPSFAQAVVVTRGTSRERVVARLHALLDTEFTDVSSRVSRLENGPPVGFPVQFRVLGKDPQVIRRIAEQVREVMRANPHTRDINFDWHEMSKAVTLEIDRSRAQALGVTPQDLSRALDALLSGVVVAEIRDGIDLIQVVGRAVAEERLNLDDLSGLNVSVADPATGGQKYISLDQIATLKTGFEEPVLWRRDRETMMLVRSDIRDKTQPPVVSGQINRALGDVRAKLPEGYRIEQAGAVEESAKSNAAIGAVMPVTILIMLAVLMVQLQDFSRLAMVLLTAPLGLIGVALALLIFRQPFGFVALLGFIALAGMIMRNSVILVEQIDSDIAEGACAYDAIINATVHRARPVLLTAAAAILAMVPLARTAFWGPMAVAIMGGLAVATILTLVFLPALYAAWFKVVPAPGPLAGEPLVQD